MRNNLRRKLSVVLCLMLLFAVAMPQAIFAGDDAPSGEQRVQYYELKVCGGPEAASADSIRVYWADLYTASQEYRISWKKAEDTQWKTTDVKAEEGENGRRSYLLNGLEPEQEYDITVAVLLMNQDGEKVAGKALALKGRTYMTAPTYVSYSAKSDGTYVDSIWNVSEKNAVLKVYRADSKDGEYVLVGEEDGRSDQAHANFKDAGGMVIFRDETVKPGKTYYYKAVSELKLVDGSVMKAESPRAYQLTSRVKPYGTYTVKQLNQKGTYAKSLTWKITSDKANYKTRLVKKEMTLAVRSSKTGTTCLVKPISVQYSYDGKKFYDMKSTLLLNPGKTIYLRIGMENKTWIRKDGQGYLIAGFRYYYNDTNPYTNSTFTAHFLDARFGMNGKVLRIDRQAEDTEDCNEDDQSYGFDEEWEKDYWANAYRIEHSHSVTMNRDLIATVTKEQTVALSWYVCPLAEGYLLRYGETEEAAKAAKPVALPKDQFSYEIRGLESGKPYYFLLSEQSRAKDGTLTEELRPYGTLLVQA